MRNLIVEIEYDSQCEEPTKHDGWKVYSFNNRHVNFKDKSEIFPLSIGLRRKLNSGTAFFLRYTEHGLCNWDLTSSETPREVDGIMIWEQPVKNLGPKTYDKRERDARITIETYTTWCNGGCYCYTIKDEDGKLIDSCCGFIGEESVAEAISEHTGTENEVELTVLGEASWIGKYHDLQKSVKVSPSLS